MRKGLKKLLCILTAATLACGTASLAACGYTFTPPEGGPEATAEVSSNGGFVVEKGEYLYFINGVETYTADNEYGAPQKGALMRIKKADIQSGENKAELVIPSLMVSGDTTAGIFIYGDRIYYATPDSRKNTSGVVENSYLDFRSAKLDGTDIKDYFFVADNSTQFRYVEGEDAVYLVYAGDAEMNGSEVSALLSYNTATGEETTLAAEYLAFAFNSADKTDPWIYYTMPVPNDAGSQDSANISNFNYQQIYRVRADWTAEKAPGAYDAAAPYKYEWTEKFLEGTDGEAPYINLGEIVLDGRGAQSDVSQYNHSQSEPDGMRLDGYTYTLRSYVNGGVYFVREGGVDGCLYYLPASALAEGWDSVAGNDGASLVKIADNTAATSKATASALYFIEEGVHHYLYVKDSEIRNVTVGENGAAAEDIAIAFDVSGATLKFLDNTSDATYKYVYFTKSNGSGMSVERAVYNGEVDDYKNLSYAGEDNKAYKSVKLLDIQHASGWYDYEVVDGTVFYADAATIGSVSYNYVSCVGIRNGDGSLKNNAEIAAFNDKYNEIMGSDGLVTTLSNHDNSKLSALISYYFKSGATAAFEENLQEAEDNGRSDTYLFTEDEKAAFKAFTENKGDPSADGLFAEDDYKDEAGKYYRTYSYFATAIGKVTEADEETIALAWRNTIQRDVAPEEEETAGLEGWEIALIVVACVLVAAGCGVLATLYLLKKRKQGGEPAPERMKVDTTDDKSVDVYSKEEEAPEAIAEPVSEEAPVEEAPVEKAPAAEPVAEPAAEPAVEPAPEPVAEPAPEAPAEEGGEEGKE